MDFHKCVFLRKGFLCFFLFFLINFLGSSIILLCQIALTFITFPYIYKYIIAKLNALGWVCTNNVEFLVSADFNRLGLYVPCPKGKQNFFSRFGSFRGEEEELWKNKL